MPKPKIAVWRYKKTGTVHRDPGCTRLAVMIAPHNRHLVVEEVVEGSSEAAEGPLCRYCYSRAGYARGGDVLAYF
jgi:hypothetical protein